MPREDPPGDPQSKRKPPTGTGLYSGSKRHKPDASSPAKMSRVLGKRPEARGGLGGFQPSTGAKKLVIKNLRTDRNAAERDLKQYYDKIYNDLDDALESIFAQRQPKQPYESLYRGVEDTCRHGEAAQLHARLHQRCESYLNHDLLASIHANCSASSNVDVLRSVHRHWVIWNAQSAIIRSIFSFLDRSNLLNAKNLEQINDKAISLFRRMVFTVSSTTTASLGGPLLAGMCELVDYDRRSDPRFHAALLRDSISMLNVLNVYGKSFEPRFLKASNEYFIEFAEERSVSSLRDYISACETLLAREDYRCNAYNFDSTTKRQLMDKAHSAIISSYKVKLLDSEDIGKLLNEHEVSSVRALYDLLRLAGFQKDLKKPWETYIKNTGATIVNDMSRGDEMAVRLLEFRRALDIMVRDAFSRDDEFTYAMRDAFGDFINDKKILSSWKTGTSKVGEMVARYIDMLLRGGLKTVPKSLLSDTQDRVDAEKSGQASTGDEDAELDRQLDHALELFRFIEGKDVFEAFYKQDLARRLLLNRSASRDAERSMLTKLKSECGSTFTQNLEQMFKDQAIAKDEMVAYKSWREGNGLSQKGVDLTVNVLSASAWPTYPDPKLLLPEEVASEIEKFHGYYVHKHTGRKLTWKQSLGHCVIKARFNKGVKELMVSAYQAVVLTLFNKIEDDPDGSLSYQRIKDSTGLEGQDLDRTLQSLACGKIRVLTKHPKGKEVNSTDTFTVNKGFTDPKYRVKINQIQLKETKEENQATHKRVARDREFETQAAIVRIMKSRKTMTHPQLVAEVINQTKSRGSVEPADIKKNIEKLIEKDYLEREGGAYTYLA